ncbi:hypothetical protein C6W10_18540 [Plantactinospora sp. BB1]|nr:hypothetical protein C6W10_18540 [Plantactinospora sp. BB1]
MTTGRRDRPVAATAGNPAHRARRSPPRPGRRAGSGSRRPSDPSSGPQHRPEGVPMIVPLRRTRRNLGALAVLTAGAALTGAPLWTVLVLALTCLAIPAAVGLHGGPALVRTLLLGATGPRTRTDDLRRREEELV